MKAEHLNGFIQGAQNTFSMFFGENPRLDKVFIKTAPYKADQVSVEINIIGALQGSAIYNMNMPSAFFVASKLMMGAHVTSFDDMAQSAVSEMANMISGQTATVFSGSNSVIDISPPALRVNAAPEDFPAVVGGVKVMCIPLIFSNGCLFEIDLLLS